LSDPIGDLLRVKVELAKARFDLYKAEQRVEKERWRTAGVVEREQREVSRMWKVREDLLAQIAAVKKENTALCAILNHPDFTAIRDKALLEVGFGIKRSDVGQEPQ